jgi:hypothetical protein
MLVSIEEKEKEEYPMFSICIPNAFIIAALKAFVTENLYFCFYSDAEH